MAYGVFIHRADSPYADSPASHYQFPSLYYSRAKKMEGDWIVYYEPTKVPGSRGYNAIARVTEVVPDPAVPRMFLARIDPVSYLPFSRAVPFVINGQVVERGLLNAGGGVSGRAQAAVRPISPEDFDRILELGMRDGEPILPRIELAGENESKLPQFAEAQAPFAFEADRARIAGYTIRVVRDWVFRRIVVEAYESRCAITGLRLINGGGRAEVNAAHIRPVKNNGPDIINNGLALSGTVHWMFDRGLLTIGEDHSILISRHINDRDGIQGLINRGGRLLGPKEARDGPHPSFLQWHRDNVFKH